MNERPPQPPEGKLIADATRMRGLSIREASSRAGISYGRWRQVTSGVQNVSPGSYAAVRAPAATLARMAQAVGITPERLETEGQRPDAAEILREMLRSEPPALRAVPSPDDDVDPAESTLDVVLLLADQRGHGKPAATIVREIREWLRVTGQTERSNGTSA